MKNQKRKDEFFCEIFSDMSVKTYGQTHIFSPIGEKIEETVTNLVTVKKDFNLYYCCHEEFQI